MIRTAVWMGCLILLAGGCAKRNPADLLVPGEVGAIVVDAQLIVGGWLPPVNLRTTQSPAGPYRRDAALVTDATVEILVSNGDTIRYEFDPYNAHYAPADGGTWWPTVLPLTTYSLRVVTSDGRVVMAETTTPDRFHVQDWLLLDDPTLAVRRGLATFEDFPGFRDSVFYVESNQLIYQDGLLEARFDRGRALAFQIGLFSLDIGSPLVIDADFLSDEDRAKLERRTSSPPLDAAANSIRLPWFAIFFEGRYVIRIYSVDRNWYDLARSLDFYGNSNIGFGSNAGDDFERPIFHVNGGIGLFGSASFDEIGFTIHPRP